MARITRKQAKINAYNKAINKQFGAPAETLTEALSMFSLDSAMIDQYQAFAEETGSSAWATLTGRGWDYQLTDTPKPGFEVLQLAKDGVRCN
jgi:hypothetical protein